MNTQKTIFTPTPSATSTLKGYGSKMGATTPASNRTPVCSHKTINTERNVLSGAGTSSGAGSGSGGGGAAVGGSTTPCIGRISPTLSILSIPSNTTNTLSSLYLIKNQNINNNNNNNVVVNRLPPTIGSTNINNNDDDTTISENSLNINFHNSDTNDEDIEMMNKRHQQHHQQQQHQQNQQQPPFNISSNVSLNSFNTVQNQMYFNSSSSMNMEHCELINCNYSDCEYYTNPNMNTNENNNDNSNINNNSNDDNNDNNSQTMAIDDMRTIRRTINFNGLYKVVRNRARRCAEYMRGSGPHINLHGN